MLNWLIRFTVIKHIFIQRYVFQELAFVGWSKNVCLQLYQQLWNLYCHCQTVSFLFVVIVYLRTFTADVQAAAPSTLCSFYSGSLETIPVHSGWGAGHILDRSPVCQWARAYLTRSHSHLAAIPWNQMTMSESIFELWEQDLDYSHSPTGGIWILHTERPQVRVSLNLFAVVGLC